AALALASSARATITIQLSAETRLDQNVALTVVANNAGDEAARDVAPEVLYQGQRQQADALAALERGTKHDWACSLPPPSGPGTFPIVIRMHYADGNGYPLSALLVHLVRTPGAPGGPVRSKLGAGVMTRSATAKLLLENPGPRPVGGRAVI